MDECLLSKHDLSLTVLSKITFFQLKKKKKKKRKKKKKKKRKEKKK
jgi:hypothetical protein